MVETYLGLGSNLGDRELNIISALNDIRHFSKVERVSKIYKTEPVDCPVGGEFLNCAAKITTEMAPDKLLEMLKDVEHRIGGKREGRNMPRKIDLDILLYGDVVLESEGLKVPHPRMGVRLFVLIPLADIAAEVKHPVTGKTIAEMRDELLKSSKHSVKRLN